MSSTESTRDARVRKFWDEYEGLRGAYRIPARAIPWYRKRVEDYIGAHPGRRLHDHTTEDLEDWLNDLGRDTRLEDWQFRQAVDALRLLFGKLLAAEWAAEFDWGRWIEGSRDLGADHRTVARDYEAEMPAPAGKGKKAAVLAARHPGVFERFLAAIRLPGYSISTERSYLGWIDRFLLFHPACPLESLGESHVRSFLEHLAVNRKVAGATQGQALNALVFFFARVLERPLGEIGPYARPHRPRRVPQPLSPDEVRRLLERMEGMAGLMARLMYGSGMRLMECVRLRVQDVDFDYHQIVVRGGKGDKDRKVPLPDSLREALAAHLAHVRSQHDRGHGEVCKNRSRTPGYARDFLHPTPCRTGSGPASLRQRIFSQALSRPGLGVRSPLDSRPGQRPSPPYP